MEDGSGVELDGPGLDLDDPTSRELPQPEINQDNAFDPIDVPETSPDYTQEAQGQDNYEVAFGGSPWQPRHASRPFNRSSILAIDFSSPASLAELAQRHEEITFATPVNPLPETPRDTSHSTVTSPAASLPTPGSVPRLKLSRREAFLLHHFVQKIAPWVRSIYLVDNCG